MKIRLQVDDKLDRSSPLSPHSNYPFAYGIFTMYVSTNISPQLSST